MQSSLTLIIPVYNVENELSRCLKSIEVLDCHIILVNDGSTDRSRDLCQEFALKHKNAKIIDKQNGGLSDARNAALPFVDTEFTFFLDSDDWISASNLNIALAFAIENNLDWVQCGYVYAYPNRQLNIFQNDNIRIINKDEVIKTLLSDGYIKNFAWGKIYRTRCIKNKRFPLGMYFEDVMWQYDIICQSHSFAIVPLVTTFYRQRENSISGTFSWRLLDLLYGMEERLKKVIIDYPEYAGIAALTLWHAANEFSNYAMRQKNKELRKFYDILQSIQENYHDFIVQGINGKTGIQRLALKLTLNRRPYAKIFILLNRLLCRLRS